MLDMYVDVQQRNAFINTRVDNLHLCMTVWCVRLSKKEERKLIHCHFTVVFETFSFLPSKCC